MREGVRMSRPFRKYLNAIDVPKVRQEMFFGCQALIRRFLPVQIKGKSAAGFRNSERTGFEFRLAGDFRLKLL